MKAIATFPNLTVAYHDMLQPYPKSSVIPDPFVSHRPTPGTWLPEDSMIRFLVASKMENIAAIKNRSSDSLWCQCRQTFGCLDGKENSPSKAGSRISTPLFLSGHRLWKSSNEVGDCPKFIDTDPELDARVPFAVKRKPSPDIRLLHATLENSIWIRVEECGKCFSCENYVPPIFLKWAVFKIVCVLSWTPSLIWILVSHPQYEIPGTLMS